eukprot:9956164-Ditylum_brightwellii.AAC.1
MNKHITNSAITILLHAKRKWPAITSTVKWLFDYRATKERHIKLDLNINGMLPLKQLLGHKEELMTSKFHTLGCPFFILDSRSQSDTGIGTPKWDPKARAGIYLGHSTFNAGNVALVLNLQTNHVRPPYHVVFDDEFSTESFNIALSWYEGESAHRNEPTDLIEDTRKLSKQDFINIETAGLRRSLRLRNLEIKSRTGFLVTTVDIISSTPAHISQCFQAIKSRHPEFLDTSFDGTHNNFSAIGHVISAELNNEN